MPGTSPVAARGPVASPAGRGVAGGATVPARPVQQHHRIAGHRPHLAVATQGRGDSPSHALLRGTDAGIGFGIPNQGGQHLGDLAPDRLGQAGRLRVRIRQQPDDGIAQGAPVAHHAQVRLDGQGQRVPRVLEGQPLQAGAPCPGRLAGPGRFDPVQVLHQPVQDLLVGVVGDVLDAVEVLQERRVAGRLQLRRHDVGAARRHLVALAVFDERQPRVGRLEPRAGQARDPLDAHRRLGQFGHRRVAVADHPLLVELARLFRRDGHGPRDVSRRSRRSQRRTPVFIVRRRGHLLRAGGRHRLGLGWQTRQQVQLGILHQTQEVLPEAARAAADVGEDHRHDLFGQVVDRIHVAVEVADVAGQERPLSGGVARGSRGHGQGEHRLRTPDGLAAWPWAP